MPVHTSQRGGRWPRLALLGLASLIAAAVLHATDASRVDADASPSSGPRPHVLVVGDSVTLFSAEELATRLHDRDVTMEAHGGFDSTNLLPLARTAMLDRIGRGERLEEASFLVGYNDVIYQVSEPEDLTELVELSAHHDCAVWLTLPARPSGRSSPVEQYDAAAVDAWNARLVELVGTHDSLHLVRDWELAVNASAPGEYLASDGIHPNEAGQQKLAAVVRDGLAGACGT